VHKEKIQIYQQGCDPTREVGDAAITIKYDGWGTRGAGIKRDASD